MDNRLDEWLIENRHRLYEAAQGYLAAESKVDFTASPLGFHEALAEARAARRTLRELLDGAPDGRR